MSDQQMRGLDGIENEEPRSARAYILKGAFELAVTKAIYKETRKGGTAVIIDFEIVTSTNEARPVGTTTTRYFDLGAERSGRGEVRDCIAKLYGAELSEVTGDVIKLAVSEKQPLIGKRVKCIATVTATKSGGEWTHCDWITLKE